MPHKPPPLSRQPQEVVIEDEMKDVTSEAIAGVFFGDYATPELMADTRRVLPAISRALFSIPVRFPWPLNRLPAFGFGRSMDARESFKSEILRVLEERRADMVSAEEGSSGGKSAGLLDSLILIQQRQKGLEGTQGGSFDDDFIVDNVRTEQSTVSCVN